MWLKSKSDIISFWVKSDIIYVVRNKGFKMIVLN